ncbi:helix-turn-helix domain-containing protein [Frankia sp. AiPs1]|nr:helix-turn-helix domain-containing protein [Frankia sp. AiPs1]
MKRSAQAPSFGTGFAHQQQVRRVEQTSHSDGCGKPGGEAGYRYRFYLDSEQSAQLAMTPGCVRYVYNRALAERSRAWRGEERSGRRAGGGGPDGFIDAVFADGPVDVPAGGLRPNRQT